MSIFEKMMVGVNGGLPTTQTLPPLTGGDPFGLAAWSAAAGTTEHVATLQMAVVLAGAAGPQAVAGGLWGIRGLPTVTPVLVSRGAHRPRALDALLSTLMDIDAHLRQRFAGYSASGLHEGHQDLAEQSQAGGYVPETRRNERNRKLLHEGDHPWESQTDIQDMEPDPLVRRLRTVLRPGIIIQCPDLAGLKKTVAHSHDSHGLVPGVRLDRLISANKTDRECFFAFLDGCQVELPESVRGGSLVTSEQGMIRALLLANAADIPSMMAHMPDFADRVILVDASPKASQSVAEPRQAASFIHRHSRVTQALLSRRRKGHESHFRESSEAGHQRLAHDEVEFLTACDASDVPCAALRQVPEFLRWALEQAEPAPGIADEDFAAIIRRCSFALLDEHQSILREIRDENARRHELDLAEKFVAKIAAKEPVSKRTLIRSFDIQQMSRYRPVLALLLEGRVIVEDSDHLLRLGERKFAALKEELTRSGKHLP